MEIVAGVAYETFVAHFTIGCFTQFCPRLVGLLVKNTGSMGINTTKGTTFSAWIKPAAENVASRVMSLAASSGEINLIIDGNNLLVQSGGQKIAAPASLVSNQWQHLAWVAKNGELSLYVNGKSVASKSR